MSEIMQAMKQGAYYGMQVFNQSLLALYNSGNISLVKMLLLRQLIPKELMMNIRGISSDSGAVV